MFGLFSHGFTYLGDGANGRRFSITDEEPEYPAEQPRTWKIISLQELGCVLAVPGVVCLVLFFLLAGCAMSKIMYKEDFVRVGAGGEAWHVAWTLVLQKSFFAGQSPQGVTSLPGTGHLVFSGKNILRMTKEDFPFTSHRVLQGALPSHLTSEGFTHIGDISSAEYAGDNLLFVPIEDEPKTAAGILTLHLPDFTFQGSCYLQQDHAPFVAVDPVNMVAYTSVFRGVTHINRYQMPGCQKLQPLPLLRGGHPVSLSGVQGASVHNGTLYLSTNQVASNGGDLFALDTETGEISLAMTLRVGGGQAEMEGLDVSADDKGLRMLVLMNYYSNPILLELRPV